jgi:hypothetical protein
MTAYGIEFPLPRMGTFDDAEVTERQVGQYVTLLMGGEAHLLKVTEAHLMPGGQMVLGCEREEPTDEELPEPIELTTEEAVAALTYERGLDLPDDACLRMEPEAPCPAAGSPRCQSCVWRPADGQA